MPDHVHLLVEGQHETADGRAFIGRSKQLTGYYYARVFGDRLWQRYGYERTLRDGEASLSVARYIVENPVRAGLVRRIEDYPFIGSSEYTLAQIVEAVQMMRGWRSG